MLGPCGSQTLHARTQTSSHGQCDGDVIDAEFALRRCHLSSTELIFFSCALFAKNVAIRLMEKETWSMQKNTPVVLVMAIAAFDLGSSVASPVYLHKCTDCRKDIIYTFQTCDKTLLTTAKTGVNCEC